MVAITELDYDGIFVVGKLVGLLEVSNGSIKILHQVAQFTQEIAYGQRLEFRVKIHHLLQMEERVREVQLLSVDEEELIVSQQIAWVGLQHLNAFFLIPRIKVIRKPIFVAKDVV